MFRRLHALIILICLAALLGAAGCAREPAPKVQPPKQEEPTISLYDNKTGQKKNIKIEEYLQGVVAAEMDTKWPVNALAAQAILARTFTMENIKSGRVQQLHGADISTSIEESQAYDPSKINDNVRQAVESTRGEVVTYQGNYIHAWFSACDGGVSATAEEGLAYTKEPTPYIKAGVEDGCLSITDPKNVAWEARIPVAQVRSAVQGKAGKDTGPITTAAIAEKGPSGRAQQIKLGGATISGPSLRLALGSEKVRSMLLSDIRVEGGQLVLTGKGFGHGVGMCQWGARRMAEQGKSPEEIVSFYFKDIEIQKQWN
ncbi:MAG: SpoIID/LytB domain-containing protein [Desulfotomaculaceae bacterium]|nr:SpoIID/LytB domain-containing protein [Desulfotomaculaceae bacterium]MDD4766573.1 SpoIID/LytB domain-containing protein [Desulfotomaculaceae bacterium]